MKEREHSQSKEMTKHGSVKGIFRDDEMIHDVYYQYLMSRLTEPDGDIAEVIIE